MSKVDCSDNDCITYGDPSNDAPKSMTIHDSLDVPIAGFLRPLPPKEQPIVQDEPSSPEISKS